MRIDGEHIEIHGKSTGKHPLRTFGAQLDTIDAQLWHNGAIWEVEFLIPWDSLLTVQGEGRQGGRGRRTTLTTARTGQSNVSC